MNWKRIWKGGIAFVLLCAVFVGWPEHAITPALIQPIVDAIMVTMAIILFIEANEQ